MGQMGSFDERGLEKDLRPDGPEGDARDARLSEHDAREGARPYRARNLVSRELDRQQDRAHHRQGDDWDGWPPV